MSRDFYDTSSFAKLFLREPASQAVVQRFRTVHEVVISDLTLIELRSAIQKLVHRRVIAQSAADAIHATIDLTVPEVTVISLCKEDFSLAEKLVRTRDLRALDALQLASAIRTATEDEMTFVVSDTKLREAAQAERLVVLDLS